MQVVILLASHIVLNKHHDSRIVILSSESRSLARNAFVQSPVHACVAMITSSTRSESFKSLSNPDTRLLRLFIRSSRHTIAITA